MLYSSFLKFPFNSFYVFYSAKISFIVRVFSFTSLIIVIIAELQLKFQFNFPPFPSPTLCFFKSWDVFSLPCHLWFRSQPENGAELTHDTGLPFFGSLLSAVPPPVAALGSFFLWTERWQVPLRSDFMPCCDHSSPLDQSHKDGEFTWCQSLLPNFSSPANSASLCSLHRGFR